MILSSDQSIALEQERVETLVNNRRKLEATVPINVDGDCINCGEPIESLRLKAYPKSTRCIKCETLRENIIKTKNQFGPSNNYI